MNRPRLVMTLALLLTAVGPAWAETVPEDDDACFCLRHDMTDQFFRGCKSFMGDTLCIDPNTCDRFQPENLEGLTRIAEGEPGCRPCTRYLRDTEELVRREGSSAESPGEECDS